MVQEFINWKKDSMTVNEYSLKFNQLYKYVPTIMVDLRARMSNIILGVSEIVV